MSFVSKESFVDQGGAAPGPQRQEQQAPADPGPYDPAGHTVAEVQSYVTDHPDERGAVMAAEEAGKNRTTLMDWLSA